jgi:predicted hydrocarbon binding protein
MTMSEDFTQFVSTMEYQDGRISSQGRRYGIFNVSWLVGIQKEMENIIGVDGTYAILDRVYEDDATTWAKMIAQYQGDVPLDQQLRGFFGPMAFRGFGVYSVTEFTEKPFLLKYQVKDSLIAGQIGGSPEPRCGLDLLVVKITKALIQAKGLAEEVVWEEAKCIAKGDPYCEHTFQAQE